MHGELERRNSAVVGEVVEDDMVGGTIDVDVRLERHWSETEPYSVTLEKRS